ncbi:MAG TPA: hypothetical protein VFZ68_09175 [Acidimicrobiales bacterium]
MADREAVGRTAPVVAYGGARAAIGAALVVAPTATTRAWLGDSAGEPAVRLAVRLMGLRDLVLGVALAARAPAGDAAGLALAAAVADAGDLVVTLANRDRLPGSAAAVAVTAGAGAATGAVLAWRARPDTRGRRRPLRARARSLMGTGARTRRPVGIGARSRRRAR